MVALIGIQVFPVNFDRFWRFWWTLDLWVQIVRFDSEV